MVESPFRLRSRPYAAKAAGPRELFAVKCLSCVFRAAEVSFDTLPPLFYQGSARGSGLWAWNRDHLLFLRSYLHSPHSREGKKSWYSVYVRREWLLRRHSLVKAIDQFLLRHNRSLQRSAPHATVRCNALRLLHPTSAGSHRDLFR
jgi:hypothetical protein